MYVSCVLVIYMCGKCSGSRSCYLGGLCAVLSAGYQPCRTDSGRRTHAARRRTSRWARKPPRLDPDAAGRLNGRRLPDDSAPRGGYAKLRVSLVATAGLVALWSGELLRRVRLSAAANATTTSSPRLPRRHHRSRHHRSRDHLAAAAITNHYIITAANATTTSSQRLPRGTAEATNTSPPPPSPTTTSSPPLPPTSSPPPPSSPLLHPRPRLPDCLRRVRRDFRSAAFAATTSRIFAAEAHRLQRCGWSASL